MPLSTCTQLDAGLAWAPAAQFQGPSSLDVLPRWKCEVTEARGGHMASVSHVLALCLKEEDNATVV